jgi:hypothetical protein
MSDGRIVSVQVLRAVRVWKNTTRWIVDAHPIERNFVTIVARLAPANDSFLDFYVFPNIDKSCRFRISLRDNWLSKGREFRDLSALEGTVNALVGSKGKSRVIGRARTDQTEFLYHGE